MFTGQGLYDTALEHMFAGWDLYDAALAQTTSIGFTDDLGCDLSDVRTNRYYAAAEISPLFPAVLFLSTSACEQQLERKRTDHKKQQNQARFFRCGLSQREGY